MSIFTEILAGNIPGHFVWKDAHCFSIMTIQPIREGHLMVIPNVEVNHWDDVPADIAAHLMETSQIIAKAIKQVVPCKRIGVSIVGLEVPHTHIHLIPIDNMGDLDFKNATALDQDKLASTAAKIREVLVAQGYAQAQTD